MQFTQKIRAGVRTGKITCSVRIWKAPRVKVGGRYKLGDGEIEVESLRRIAMSDITPELARRSGFDGVVDLMKTAKHGYGEQVFLVEFRFRPGRRS